MDLTTPCVYSDYGNLNGDGYVMVWSTEAQRYIGAHRVALEQRLGRELDPGEQAGHACHDKAAQEGLCLGGRSCSHRRCVNPEHLTVQSHAENKAASPLNGGAKKRLTISPDALAEVLRNPQPFYSFRDIGLLTGVADNTLRVWRIRGRLPEPDQKQVPPLWGFDAIRAWLTVETS